MVVQAPTDAAGLVIFIQPVVIEAPVNDVAAPTVLVIAIKSPNG